MSAANVEDLGKPRLIASNKRLVSAVAIAAFTSQGVAILLCESNAVSIGQRQKLPS